MDSIQAFIDKSQEVVNGIIKLQLFKGNVMVLGRKSESSLYDKDLATYTASDSFDQEAAKGFIKLWGLPTQVYQQVQLKNKQAQFVQAVTKSQLKDKVTVHDQYSTHTGAKNR